MRKWILKAIVQKTISYFPCSDKFNYFFQKFVTRAVNLTDLYFYDRLFHAREHLRYYSEFSAQDVPDSSLELGTGWYPIVPIAFFLSGVNHIYSIDIKFLTSKTRIETTLNKFIEANNSGKLSEYINVKPERLAVIQEIIDNYSLLSLEEILKRINLIYVIEDARSLSLEGNSIDLVNSNNTFEHIYPKILVPILEEMRRVAKKEVGIMSHFIDMTDHFANIDKSINRYNFLKFSDKMWAIIDNDIQPQSRLRIYDYKKIYSDLGIPISAESHINGDINEIQNINLESKFLDYPIEQVAIYHCHFVSKL